MTERETQLDRLEALGTIDRDCPTCQQYFLNADNPLNVIAPRHTASTRCMSGRRPHCTCDTCF